MARKRSRQPTMDAVNEDGYTPAEQAAYDHGYEEGHEEGYEEGLEAEREDEEDETGEEDITEEALYQQGHAAGYSAGYDDGYAAAQAQGQAGSEVDPEEPHPLRRIVAAHEYVVHGAQCFYPDLSCGHMGEDERTEAAILKDVAKRRRVVCRECQSDV